jgi:hypothetical protein
MAEKEITLAQSEAEAAEKLRSELSNLSGAQRAASRSSSLGWRYGGGV